MRPIVLATDYGISGSYVGQLKSVIYKQTPNAQIIDLIHDLPAFNPKASAYLLASHLEYIPENSVVVGVVDPGVGSAREPIVLEGDGFAFVGPNNGLFSIIARKLSNVKLDEIHLIKEPISKTFHGRDIFAPTAAQIVINSMPVLESLSIENLVGIEYPNVLFEIIYIDHYGNAITGITCNQIKTDQAIKINDYEINFAETFSSVEQGKCFWYCNSNGLIEIAARETSATEIMNLSIGTKLSID